MFVWPPKICTFGCCHNFVNDLVYLRTIIDNISTQIAGIGAVVMYMVVQDVLKNRTLNP